VGVARSDADGMLATPVETIARGDGDVDAIASMAGDLDVIEIYVGLPLALSGAQSASTRDAISFAQHLSVATSVPVRMIDERLTTVSAHSALRLSGKKASRSRSVVDQVAAVMLLQHALDSERAQNATPGLGLADVS